MNSHQPSARGSQAERGADKRNERVMKMLLRHTRGLSTRLMIITATGPDEVTHEDVDDWQETVRLMKDLAALARPLLPQRPPRAEFDYSPKE